MLDSVIDSGTQTGKSVLSGSDLPDKGSKYAFHCIAYCIIKYGSV